MVGKTVDNSWFEAINMSAKAFMDPHVMDIYRMCLDWESYKKSFVTSVYQINREKQINTAVRLLIERYNPEL